ncbi:MAG TPA: hypothetical protein VGO90_04425, partial [Chthoniobacteraceae bacterium]|nr:hypothetical protein [Chthoniobacteraceae bacterium]
YFPHGFEIAGRWLPEALAINDRFLVGLANGLGSCYADDHIIGHHTWSYLLTYQHWIAERPVPIEPKQGRLHFKHAGILIERRGPAVLYLALNKGGVFKFFLNGRLAHSDTQFSARIEDGKLRTAVAHLVAKYDVEFGDEHITIRGKLGWAKMKQMTTFNLIALRGLMFTVGRFFPDLIRKILQRILITGKKSAPLEFTRTLAWNHEQLNINDQLSSPSWDKVHAVGIGSSQTSIYVVMSRTWQAGQLQPWLDLTAQVRALKNGEPLTLTRTL